VVHLLSETAKLIPNDRSRACLHAWSRIDDGVDGTVEALVPTKGTGRAQDPTTIFRRDQIEGLEVFTHLLANRARLVSDTTTEPPQGWDPGRPRQYKSFVSAPVTVGGRLWGMLSLDSPQPGELQEHHLLGVRFMASMLGNALAAGHVTGEGPAVSNTSTITLPDGHRQVIRLPDPTQNHRRLPSDSGTPEI
jgi:GAF domain-containing protein